MKFVKFINLFSLYFMVKLCYVIFLKSDVSFDGLIVLVVTVLLIFVLFSNVLCDIPLQFYQLGWHY